MKYIKAYENIKPAYKKYVIIDFFELMSNPKYYILVMTSNTNPDILKYTRYYYFNMDDNIAIEHRDENNAIDLLKAPKIKIVLQTDSKKEAFDAFRLLNKKMLDQNKYNL
jgi:hypothetical protein